MAKSRACSTKLAGLLDTPVRRLVHNPHAILREMVCMGQTVLDIGCGPGHFTLAMAEMVGDGGLVIAADLQQEMLDRLHKHALAQGLQDRIRLLKTSEQKIGIDTQVDFVLAFYMVHEVPEPECLLQEIYDNIKPGGRLLLSEPKLFVSRNDFITIVDIACNLGFKKSSEPRVWQGMSVLLER